MTTAVNQTPLALRPREAAKALRGLHGDIDRVLKRLEQLRESSQPGARLARWQLFPADRPILFGEKMLSGEALLQLRDGDALVSAVTELSRLAKHGSNQLGPNGEQRGAPRKTWLTYFIFIVAEAFKAAGGIVSAAWQDDKGKRESRFLLVLTEVHSHLPHTRQAKPISRLVSRAREAITLIKRDKANIS